MWKRKTDKSNQAKKVLEKKIRLRSKVMEGIGCWFKGCKSEVTNTCECKMCTIDGGEGALHCCIRHRVMKKCGDKKVALPSDNGIEDILPGHDIHDEMCWIDGCKKETIGFCDCQNCTKDPKGPNYFCKDHHVMKGDQMLCGYKGEIPFDHDNKTKKNKGCWISGCKGKLKWYCMCMKCKGEQVICQHHSVFLECDATLHDESVAEEDHVAVCFFDNLHVTPREHTMCGHPRRLHGEKGIPELCSKCGKHKLCYKEWVGDEWVFICHECFE